MENGEKSNTKNVVSTSSVSRLITLCSDAYEILERLIL